MRKFTLIATGVVAAFYLATSPAQAHYYDYCGLPYWYPQSWTVMTRLHCLPEYSAIYYHRHRHAGYRRTYIASRRPYLRPGWWW